jgi:16S rRNA (guanine966-N2)-methyltransferase
MPEAGRVIAGTAGGRRLLAPGPGTRPLSDRVKQTLFAILEPDLPGARALDLFAGSGAAGIEALSRGAREAVFVERDPGAVRVIRENLRRAGFPPAVAEVVQAEALGWLRSRGPAAGPFDVVVVDPPYAETALLVLALAALGDPDAGILAPDARVVAKHFWRDAPPARIGLLASERSRRFGETALTFYSLEGAVLGERTAPGGPASPADASRGES